jgi:hypothetical protein
MLSHVNHGTIAKRTSLRTQPLYPPLSTSIGCQVGKTAASESSFLSDRVRELEETLASLEVWRTKCEQCSPFLLFTSMTIAPKPTQEHGSDKDGQDDHEHCPPAIELHECRRKLEQVLTNRSLLQLGIWAKAYAFAKGMKRLALPHRLSFCVRAVHSRPGWTTLGAPVAASVAARCAT